MLNFFKKLSSSAKFMDRLALEIGVEKKLFKAALTELGIDFSKIEQEFEQVFHDRLSQSKQFFHGEHCDDCRQEQQGYHDDSYIQRREAP